MGAITAVRGFKDILPPESDRLRRIEGIAIDVFRVFGFREIRVPLVEKTELFRRSIGEATDIVEKEMYTFVDRGDESLTLRPEATASVIRAYLEHAIYSTEQVSRLFTIGPMFRRERPQKGRYRQFHQIDAEVLGSSDAHVDAELIIMAVYILERLGLKNLCLELNSLGCDKCRPSFRNAVLNFLKDVEGKLCHDCGRRMTTNPLRVFDCKVPSCREALGEAPKTLAFLCEECGRHFETVKGSLDLFGTKYRINTSMVRGLDYYTRTAFEVTTESLGAQNAVLGGGRYDRLIRDLGGPDIPGIGFAMGLERVASLCASDDELAKPPSILFAPLGEKAIERSFFLVNRLRKKGMTIEVDFSNKSLKGHLKRADKMKSNFVVIIGEREIEENQALIRDMKEGTQRGVPWDKIEETLLQLVR